MIHRRYPANHDTCVRFSFRRSKLSVRILYGVVRLTDTWKPNGGQMPTRVAQQSTSATQAYLVQFSKCKCNNIIRSFYETKPIIKTEAF